MQTEGDHSTASMLPGARWVRWGLILVPDVVQSEWYLTLSEDPGAHEEPGAPAEAWSFADLAALAAQSYPSITARLQEREAAEGDRRVAGWARFPTPGVEASVDDSDSVATPICRRRGEVRFEHGCLRIGGSQGPMPDVGRPVSRGYLIAFPGWIPGGAGCAIARLRVRTTRTGSVP